MGQYKNIPLATDNRNISQVDIQTNFNYLTAPLNGNDYSTVGGFGLIPVDHYASGDNVANPTDGFHKQVSFLDRTSPSNLTNSVNSQASSSILYTRVDGIGNSQLHFKNSNQDTQISVMRAFGLFNGTTGAALGNIFGISTVTHTATGKFTVNFSPSLPNTNYMYLLSVEQPTSGSADVTTIECVSRATGTMGIECRERTSGSNQYYDPVSFTVVIMGLY